MATESARPTGTQRRTLRISADVVSRFGAELFSSSYQALLELIKNAYDADATQVRLAITSPTRPLTDHQAPGQLSLEASTSEEPAREAEGDRPPSDLAGTGSLEIADNGIGMTQAIIEQGWLTLSASPKRPTKQAGLLTARGRTPLGDKGLGRLGAQRLGAELRMRTRPKGSAGIEHDVTIDFREFRPGVMLDEIELELATRDASSAEPWPLNEPHGTVLTIRGLRDPADLTDERLLTELGRLINPFRPTADVRLTVRVDGHRRPLPEVGSELRAAALSRIDIDYADGILRIDLMLKADWFRLRNRRQQERLEQELFSDDPSARGALLADLSKEPKLAGFAPHPAEDPFYVRMSRTWTAEALASSDLPDEDCGPFTAQLEQLPGERARAASVLERAGLPISATSLLNRQRDYAALLADLRGVSVYRDGFRVASENDLLDLGAAFTSGGSFYGLRPQNVVGYVQITARDNPLLEEATDRETFRRTAAFERFDRLLALARDAVNKMLDEAGRTAVEHVKASQAAEDELSTEPEDVERAAQASREAYRSAQARIEDATRSLAVVGDQGRTESERRDAAGTAARMLTEASEQLEGGQRVQGLVELLSEESRDRESALAELYETAGLGLVAEALSHEIAHIVSRLDERARRSVSGPSGETQRALLTEEVRAATGALRGQLRHLDPMTRRARVARQRIDLGEMVRSVVEYHAARLKPHGTTVEATVVDPAVVSASRGRLMQIVDNLVINAEHWVKGRGSEDRLIEVAVQDATVIVRDSGPGIPEDRAEAIFAMGVSDRPSGRGLGLFVARQLADLDEATLTLAPSRTGEPRNSFVLDLTARRVEP